MGAQLYQVVKLAEADGEPCVFRQTEREHFALAAKEVWAELDADIAQRNTKLEGELLEFLHEILLKQVELLISQLLTAIDFEDVAVTKYWGDDGIDVDATLTRAERHDASCAPRLASFRVASTHIIVRLRAYDPCPSRQYEASGELFAFGQSNVHHHKDCILVRGSRKHRLTLNLILLS